MQDDVAAEISDLERQIEALWDQHRGALKTILLARWAFWIGLGLMALVFLGQLRSNTIEAGIAGLSLFLGGIIFSGSSRASADQLHQRINELESERDNLIDQLSLHHREETPSATILAWPKRPTLH